MKKLLACILVAVLMMTMVTSMMPTMSAEAAEMDATAAEIKAAALEYRDELLSDPLFGRSVGYSSTWFYYVDEIDVVARLLYAATDEIADRWALSWMLWNRRESTAIPFSGVNTLFDVVIQANQFYEITGWNDTLTQNARTPSTSSSEWKSCVLQACYLWKAVELGGTPVGIPSTLTGFSNQLYCVDFNTFEAQAEDSSHGYPYLGSQRIGDIFIPMLGPFNTTTAAINRYLEEDDEGYSMLDSPVLIYYNHVNN